MTLSPIKTHTHTLRITQIDKESKTTYDSMNNKLNILDIYIFTAIYIQLKLLSIRNPKLSLKISSKDTINSTFIKWRYFVQIIWMYKVLVASILNKWTFGGGGGGHSVSQFFLYRWSSKKLDGCFSLSVSNVFILLLHLCKHPAY